MGKFLIAVFVIIGYSINSSHEASRTHGRLFDKYLEFDTFRETGKNIEDDSSGITYAKVSPGTKIYFYATGKENVVKGPRLRSDDPIEISFVDPNGKPRGKSQLYAALKSGVLVPRPKGCERESNESFQREKPSKEPVYRSSRSVEYVKGFKNILIPSDVLHPKSNAGCGHPFGCPTSKNEPISREQDSVKNRIGPDEKLTFSDEPENVSIDFPDKYRSNETDEEIFPDKTCDGEVTLFVLRNDGVLKRVSSDPYMPIGLRQTYSLSENLIFRPKFLGGSDLVVTYVTGQNGDLVPHSDNRHKITSELGRFASFMLSKNGGLFPVEEKKKSDNLIAYYFNGRLVHESDQFAETHANSSWILIDDRRFGLFDGGGGGGGGNDSVDSPALNDISENADREVRRLRRRRRRHRLRKRDLYYDGHDRNGRGHPQPESHAAFRRFPPNLDSHPTSRRQPHHVVPQGAYVASDHLPIDSRHSDAADSQYPLTPQSFAGDAKAVRANFDMTFKPSSGYGGSAYSEPNGLADGFEPQREEPPSDPVSTPTWDETALTPRTDLFIFDDNGVRIRLVPEITDNNDVIIYKLTCKGNLVRYPSCKEPEFGFEINFQLLLDEFVLVPTVSMDSPHHLTFVLQENGDLIPAKGSANTFRKAPGSLIYYMLGKNNVLFPVQQVIDAEGNVSFFYQDHLLLKIKDSIEKPLHFTTKGSPLFAFFNGLTMIATSSKPRLNPRDGSNWNHLKPSEDRTESPTKTMYLTGPKGETIRISPYKNREGSTVVYELDCNGILYRSPKDKKKCIILKSYVLLKEGILLPSNDTNGYVYMMSKNGDLFPYLYPDGKIEAPLASSLKYVLCEKGILLPIKLEIMDNSVCYLFRDVVVYKERVYCRTCLDRLDRRQLDYVQRNKKSSCGTNRGNQTGDIAETGITLFVNKNGDHVFYEKQNKMLKRHPPEVIPSYLKYTMGSFEIMPDGSLHQIPYRNPSRNVANLMLEPNGDLLEDTRNVNDARSDYYLLDAKGNLIAVEARKTKKNIYFYRGGTKVCKVPIPVDEDEETVSPANADETKPPLGKDPLGLMDDPFPVSGGAVGGGNADGTPDSRSLYIPIPLKSVSVSNAAETHFDRGDAEQKKKCDMLKDTLKQVSKGDPLPLSLELELTDDIIEELKNWAEKCDKVLSRRDATGGDVRNYMNVLALRCRSNLGKMNLPVSLMF